MTGKVVDSSAKGLLVALLPLALVIMVVFVAWPFILGIFILSLGWKLWQTYQWQKLAERIDPLFNQLIQAHQGSLTVLDVSMKTSLNAATAKWYLDRKADQYGAVKRLYEDKGIVYYFLTASALGSILDDSEPESEFESVPAINSPSSSSQTLTVKKLETGSTTITSESRTNSSPTVIATSTISEQSKSDVVSTSPSSIENIETDVNRDEAKKDSLSLNQSELAKRLEVHSSTIGKRKSDQDFGLWSLTRDPDGIPWQYLEDEKIFVPLEE